MKASLRGFWMEIVSSYWERLHINIINNTFYAHNCSEKSENRSSQPTFPVKHNNQTAYASSICSCNDPIARLQLRSIQIYIDENKIRNLIIHVKLHADFNLSNQINKKNNIRFSIHSTQTHFPQKCSFKQFKCWMAQKIKNSN